MPVACFYNFSDYPFTGRWNSEDQTFAPKSKTFMPAFLAQHFAKHLVNRELHRKGLDHATSPKVPEDVPEFNELFRMAYIREREIPGQKRTTLQEMIDVVDKNFRSSPVANAPAVLPVSAMGPDVEPKPAPREPSEKEDPMYLPEENNATPGAHAPAKADAKQPQVVLPPDFEEDDEFEGVSVPPKAPDAPAPVTTA